MANVFETKNPYEKIGIALNMLAFFGLKFNMVEYLSCQYFNSEHFKTHCHY